MDKVIRFIQSQRFEQFLARIYFNLHFPLIILSFLTLFFFSGFLRFYNFDEFLVTTIGKQPLPQLFDTILSEPHPPGFYLLIHFLSQFFTDSVSLKRAFFVLSFGLLSVAFAYAQKVNLLKKFKLQFGVLLFLSTYGFIEVFNNVKQDIITFPLLLLLSFMCLHFWEMLKRKQQLTFLNYAVLTILNLTIFFFGYIAFAWSFLLTGLLLSYEFWRSKKITSLLPLFIISVIVGTYFISFGWEQYLINKTRFIWINYQNNSFVPNLSVFLIGVEPSHIITDTYLLGFFSLLALGIESLRKKKVNLNLFVFLSCLFTIALLFSYQMKLLSQTRYLFFPYFLLSLIIGWSSEVLSRKSILLFIIFFITCMKTGIFVRGQQAAFSSITDSLDIWQPFFEKQQTGFLSSAPIGSYFFYLQFFPKEENLIPINLKNLDQIKGSTIERDHLVSDGQLFRLSSEDSRQRLADLYLSRFIFIDLPTQAFFDPNKTVLKVLQTHCSSEFNSSQFADYATYFFTDCRFN